MRTATRAALLAVALGALAPSQGFALDPVDTTALVNAIDEAKIRVHLNQLQAIANNQGGTRVAGSPGYTGSVNYVRQRLAAAGYTVQVQPFRILLFEEQSPPEFATFTPRRRDFRPNIDFFTMEYSGSGEVQAPLALAGGIIIPPTANPSSQSGCLASHFPASVRGKVVLIQRGTCTFFEKARNAARAGARAAIIFNEGQPGRREPVNGTLGEPVPIPVIGVSFATGKALYDFQQPFGRQAIVRIKVDATITPINTVNVIGEKLGPVRDRAVVVGAHLDSVAEGPGINDNGSGTATILTIAEQMTRLGIAPRNTVRFAFWGAEEEGLHGSNFYVENLTEAQLAAIAANLNFDMLGSPNFIRAIYDGDGTIGPPGPPGSDEIEQVFEDFFDARGQASEPTLFDGRSDYLAFITAGIPAGGLFSGAEAIKTPQQQARYGGVAGRPLDPCYHQACDTIANLSNQALREMGKAAAHAVGTLALTTEDVRGSASASQVAALRSMVSKAEYRGPHLVR